MVMGLHHWRIDYRRCADEQYDQRAIVDTSCVVSGSNPFREVSGGYIRLAAHSKAPYSRYAGFDFDRIKESTRFDTVDDEHSVKGRDVLLAGFQFGVHPFSWTSSHPRGGIS